MHSVKKVEYLDGYRLRLYFYNREVRIIDLRDDLKNSKNKFRDLIDMDYFKKVKCVRDSIAWPNGIDYCPDWLHMNSQPESKPMVRKKTARPKPSSKKSMRGRKTAGRS